MLVNHIDGYRRLWMFPRNIRSIPPWKIAQILTLVNDALRNVSWSGDPESQERFAKALEYADLKKPGERYDPNSGGPRTYLAQLKALGLLFERSDGTVWLTIAGQNLIEGNDPLLVMQRQLLRHQYPSSYGNLPHVKINPDIRIKPFLFLLQLCSDPDLQGITYEEMMIPVIYGHNFDCYHICKEKIIRWRNTGRIPLDDPRTDLYTPRTIDRDQSAALEDVKAIANTFKNCLHANCLIETDRRINGRFYIRPEAGPIIASEILEINDLKPFETHEKFQRIYGRSNRSKDNRSLRIVAETSPRNQGDSVILSRFMEYCGENIVTESPEEFIESFHTQSGFTTDQIRSVIAPFLRKSMDIYESTYLNLSCGGKTCGVPFEKATEKIFRDTLHFDTKHIGQLRRKGKGVGGYSDILLIPFVAGKCAIIDTKASGLYSLDSSDYRAMAHDYIENYREVAEDRELEFCAYVAGGFSPGFEERLRTMTEETGVPASGITAQTLLELAKKQPGPAKQSRIRRIFSTGTVLRHEMFGSI